MLAVKPSCCIVIGERVDHTHTHLMRTYQSVAAHMTGPQSKNHKSPNQHPTAAANNAPRLVHYYGCWHFIRKNVPTINLTHLNCR